MSNRLLQHSFSLLHIDHVKLDSKWNYPHVISPYFRIYFIDAGEGTISDEYGDIKLEPGYLYIVPSFTPCNLHCDSFLSQYFLHFFEESANGLSLFEYNRRIIRVRAREMDRMNISRLLELNPGRGINRSDNPKIYEKNDYYRDYQELNKTVSESTFIETQGIILQLISRFLVSRKFDLKKTEPIPSKILESMSYIQLNLKEYLTVSLLAKRASLHQDYFSRLFYRFTGERPLSYIHTKRIERAQYLMTTTRLTYAEIAEETGFENVPHFAKVFKKVTRVTPGTYKKRNQHITDATV